MAAASVAQISIQISSQFLKLLFTDNFKNLVSVIYTIFEAHVRRNVFGFHAKSRSWICVAKLEIAFLSNEVLVGMYCDCIFRDPGQSALRRVGFKN